MKAPTLDLTELPSNSSVNKSKIDRETWEDKWTGNVT